MSRALKIRNSRVVARAEYEVYQDLILEKAGVDCSVLVKADRISIRTESYSDYIVATGCIKHLANGKEIVKAETLAAR